MMSVHFSRSYRNVSSYLFTCFHILIDDSHIKTAICTMILDTFTAGFCCIEISCFTTFLLNLFKTKFLLFASDSFVPKPFSVSLHTTVLHAVGDRMLSERRRHI